MLSNHPAYDPALPTKEAANYLGLHSKSLLKLVKDRRLPHIESKGGRFHFRLSALNSYLDSMQIEPRESKPPKKINWGI